MPFLSSHLFLSESVVFWSIAYASQATLPGVWGETANGRNRDLALCCLAMVLAGAFGPPLQLPRRPIKSMTAEIFFGPSILCLRRDNFSVVPKSSRKRSADFASEPRRLRQARDVRG